MKGYPRWFTKSFVVLSMALVTITGCLLIPSLLDMRLQWQQVWDPLKDHRTMVVATHTLSGIWIMVILGALWSIHMRVGWRAKERRATGLITVLLFLSVAVSSIAVLYAGEESLSLNSSLIHTILGVTLVPLFSVHILKSGRAANG